MSDEACSMNVWIFLAQTALDPDNCGLLSKCRFHGTEERVLAAAH